MLTEIGARVASSFAPPPAPLPIFWSMVTEKPGPSAASASGAGCVAATTRPRAAPWAHTRLLQSSICSRRGRNDALERYVHVRIAEQDGHIYLDLADEHTKSFRIERLPSGKRASMDFIACFILRLVPLAGNRKQWIGPPGLSAANNQATTNTILLAPELAAATCRLSGESGT
jgi:hypothetical protein